MIGFSINRLVDGLSSSRAARSSGADNSASSAGSSKPHSTKRCSKATMNSNSSLLKVEAANARQRSAHGFGTPSGSNNNLRLF